jgi:hypothetical protein
MSLLSFLPTFIKSQFFEHPKLPSTDCIGKTIIVTGANVGLGKEAARHFVAMNAAKVILACRTVSKGEAARADIEATTKRSGVVQVWQLDLEDHDSIRKFVQRAETLDRLDVVLENAGESRCVPPLLDIGCDDKWGYRAPSNAVQAGQWVRDRHLNQCDFDISARLPHPPEASGVGAPFRHSADIDHCRI